MWGKILVIGFYSVILLYFFGSSWLVWKKTKARLEAMKSKKKGLARKG